jgi:quercetin dioxygenase-like cupin family protein
MTEPTVIPCDDLDGALQKYKALGYRLDMIFPADSPREALLSEPPASAGSLSRESNQLGQIRLKLSPSKVQPPATAGGSDWIAGRAGMEYLDLIPGRMDGKVIASHIRLGKGGEVADYVHYHKVEFQMIRCIKGRIKVVYEDQGPPFWLEQGDWVIQPPEIRHRVLECTAGSEVIEISMPAEHETWVEHEMDLPNDTVNPDRDFSGQKFVRFVATRNADVSVRE